MAREATDVCSRVLKESNKLKVGSTATVVTEEQCIKHIPYYLSGLSRAHFPTTFLEIAVYTARVTALDGYPRQQNNPPLMKTKPQNTVER